MKTKKDFWLEFIKPFRELKPFSEIKPKASQTKAILRKAKSVPFIVAAINEAYEAQKSLDKRRKV